MAKRKPPVRDAAGYRVVWDWDPWARFLGARAEMIHRLTAEGRSVAAIQCALSLDPVQVQLIAQTKLETMPGIPGQVWPPKEFQKPKKARALKPAKRTKR